MEQRRVQSFTSSPYQYVGDYAGSQDVSRCDSLEPIILKPVHGSCHERSYIHQYANEAATTRSLSAPIDAFDPWILEGPPCGSPLSTSSTISYTDSVPTPPYAGMPMYDTVDSPVFQHIRSPTNNNAWSGEPEPVWRPSYPEVTVWGSQQFSLPYHGGPSCDQMALQPVREYIPQAGPSLSPSYTQYDAALRYCAPGVVGPASLKHELASHTDNSDVDSGSESDFSDSDDEESLQKSPHSISRGSGTYASVMKLGKWDHSMCAFPTASEARRYRCPLEDKYHAGNPCPKKFARPEHLRRHVNTVHGNLNERSHMCKVCPRLFSRGDNLRDHYWTHLERGGRAGKNIKMTLLELKAILGPKEKMLVKRLKMKLHASRAKLVKGRF
ncbi:hypothetical protein G6011_10252 [Alternaria panax]|uniref:C2H2-type domain-containing protein n=1 Tax=Alternaria panax TaxID=48097 RepID=A0AAD4IBK3_9PLEO|nr:hypothetical protein G6011_10252 [Alternaria panax]